ncbi:MAG: LytTR family DNA-binding domain-containing protein [Proteiniphilum sp.]|nr:LytTR family DNA-binding domain-containing protein [Proteiniphilum sp.]MDD3901235.1 LytTR family DNA-binding domain-containing protein [Dysgonamonadaceae bacterium]
MKTEKQIKPIKIVVADDIFDTLNMVCALVEEVCPYAHIKAKCTTLAETRKAINKHHPDVVLLDIQFSAEGETAFDLLDTYKKSDSEKFRLIIFSGHCEASYYDMAFHYQAVHFLPKPIDKLRLKEALERTISPVVEKNDLPINGYRKDKLVVSTITASHFIAFNDIVHLQSKDSRTYITLANEEVIKSSRNLGYYEAQISENDNFVRIHNNTIVNLKYVQGISNKTERGVILKSPFGEIKSSRERFKELLDKLL